MATTLKYKSGSTWVDILHPVGSMWLSHQSTSPSSLFGGTWTQLTNAVLRAANAYGYNGSDTMSLTVNQMPAHSHTIHAFFKTYMNVAGSGYATAPIDWDTISTNSTGGGNRFRNCLAIAIYTVGSELHRGGVVCL